MNNLNQMVQDIVATSKIAQVPCSEKVVKGVLETFQEGFSTGAVQFRTTNKPLASRDLDVRYERHNLAGVPLERAWKHKLLTNQRRGIDRIMPQFHEQFPMFADGLDFSVSKGLTKLWLFFDGAYPVDDVRKVKDLPPSVLNYRKYYEKYHLNSVCIVGADYHSETINLYFRVAHPDLHNPAILKSMVQHLGFDIPNDKLMEYSAGQAALALTYSWNSPRIERICFYVPWIGREAVPNLHPLLKDWVQQVPVLQQPIYVVSWTFGVKGTYLKMENDYTGNVMEYFARAAGAAV